MVPLNNFQCLVRAYSKYIKDYQHVQFANCGKNSRIPRRLERMKKEITSMVHPAFPSPNTDLLQASNAKNWVYI